MYFIIKHSLLYPLLTPNYQERMFIISNGTCQMESLHYVPMLNFMPASYRPQLRSCGTFLSRRCFWFSHASKRKSPTNRRAKFELIEALRCQSNDLFCATGKEPVRNASADALPAWWLLSFPFYLSIWPSLVLCLFSNSAFVLTQCRCLVPAVAINDVILHRRPTSISNTPSASTLITRPL